MSRASLAAAFVAAVAVLRSPEAAAFGVDKLHLRRQAAHGAARDFLNFPARVRPVSGSSLDDSDSDDDKSVFEDVQAMTVKEIKAELKSIGIRSDDVFEKIDIVRRLVKARSGESAGSASKGSPVTSSTASPSATSTRAGQPSSRSRDGAVSVPLSFYSLENFRTIDASNAAPVYVRPSPGQFASIKAELPSKGKSLTLLGDTACSGLVLRPSSVERLGIVTSNARGSMTSAGGRSGNIEVAQVESFLVGGSRFGALTAAVQDIGALPSPLDGIIGLAFLGQFATVDFDFAASKLDLYQQDSSPQVPRSLGKVATAQMAMTGLGIYTVDVLLDGRGPVKMLADTGAASTILNWKGLSDMGLDQNSSPEVTKNREDMGAIGADNGENLQFTWYSWRTEMKHMAVFQPHLFSFSLSSLLLKLPFA